MNRVRTFTILYLSLLLGGWNGPCHADAVRGRVQQSFRLGNGTPESAVLALKVEDLWTIQLEEEIDLLRGIEIFVETPKEAQQYRGTYALYLFGNPSPPPSPTLQTYEAKQLLFKPFMNERRLYVQVPLFSRQGFLQAPDTVILDKAVERTDFPFLLTIFPIMKGFPDAALNAEFKVQVRPLFKNLGKVRFSIKSPKGPIPFDKAKVYLGDQILSLQEPSITLEPGLKNFRIEVEGYPPFQATVALERGKVVTLEATFIKKVATVRINAPLGTYVFLDGKPLASGQNEVSVDPGEHTFSFRLGDYQVSKRFYMEQGKTYEVSLYLDILINED